MAGIDQKSALEALILERGEDFSSLSRLIGRNPAYIQQFIRRGVPKKLDEADRRTLASYFGVAEEALGGPPARRILPAEAVGAMRGDLVVVRRLSIGASAGPGAVVEEDAAACAPIGFSPDFLRSLASVGISGLSMIRVAGDSMSPTLADGDEILVDGKDAADRLRDGIYVLRIEDALIVKRVARQPAGRHITISSDNPTYPRWPDRDPAELHVVGRVLWAGRRVG